MHKAGANLQPTAEFHVADELLDRFHAMKQRWRAIELRRVALAVSTALTRPGELGQRFVVDCVAG